MVDVAWIALSLIDHVGAKKLGALLDHFGGDSQAVLDADIRALREVRGVGPKIAAAIRAVDLAFYEAAIPVWQAQGVRLITTHDADYPSRLRRLDDAPPTLFVLGDLGDDFARAVAVVGTRQPTPEAARAAREIGAALAGQGRVVVSGLALGVDTEAHLGALDAGGRTIAVLGSGVLRVYPERNQALAGAVLACGALVGEVAPNASPTPSGLVARNRIISGLSDAVIVVETGVDGGAMHAARRAFDQGRDVYTLNLEASGNRALLDEGAKPLSLDLSWTSQLP